MPRSEWVLFRPAFVVGLISAYLLLHFTTRLSLGQTLGFDDAEQILFAQSWRLSYRIEQPPLFTWALTAVLPVFGPNILAVSIVRYTVMAVGFLAMYQFARRATGHETAAVLSILSFAAIYVFAYFAHHDLTHTTVLAAMIAVSLLIFSHLAERPTLVRYGVFGVAIGLGVLAKWNFVMLPLALAVTCLLDRRYRSLVIDPRTLVTVAAAAIVAAPTLIWVLAHVESVGAVRDTVLSDGDEPGRVWQILSGTGALSAALLLFPQPFAVIFAVLFGPRLWQQGQAQGWRALARDADRRARGPGAGFLARFVGVAVLAHWLVVPVLGATEFTERWMHPALMGLPVVCFGLLPAIDRARVTVYLWTLAALALLAWTALVARPMLGADYCGSCRALTPYPELTESVAGSLSDQPGTIITSGFHAGGNLRAGFPDARVIDAQYPPPFWPETGGGTGVCMLAWGYELVDGEVPLPRSLATYATDRLGLDPDRVLAEGRAEAAMYGSDTRVYALAYRVIEGTGQTC